jgi:hypothetical protein
VSTKYSDKLYAISMKEPNVWRDLKKEEFRNKEEENQD